MPGSLSDNLFSKTRHYLNLNKELEFDGKKLECLVYEDSFKQHLSSLQGQPSNTFEYSMISYYAKGIGLVRYTLKLPEGELKDFFLKSIDTHM